MGRCVGKEADVQSAARLLSARIAPDLAAAAAAAPAAVAIHINSMKPRNKATRSPLNLHATAQPGRLEHQMSMSCMSMSC